MEGTHPGKAESKLTNTGVLSKPPEPEGEAGLKALSALLRHKSLLAALETLHNEMGDIFRVTLPRFNPVVMVGPEANRYLLITNRHDLRWRMEHDPVTKLLRHGLLVVDEDEHDELRRVMNPAMHRSMLINYIDDMVCCTDQITSTWRSGERQDMLDEMRRVALLILFQTLFKVDFAPDLERLWSSILRTLKYISPGPWLFWPGIPRPGYKRAIRQLDDYLFEIIRARRKAGGEADDLLGRLVSSPQMSNDLIRDQLATMFVAGHDTSTALMAWTLYLLGCHPDVMARLQAEIDGVLGCDPPTYQLVGQLKYLDQVVKEVLRMYPPVHAGMRLAAVDLEFQNYRIPAGTRLMYSVYLSHRQPEYWPEPSRFDPERFGPEQSRQRVPNSYVPFGGGPRNCIGAAFGLVETKVVLARVLQQFNLTLSKAKVHPHMGATLEPSPGVLMLVQRRSNA